MFVLLFITDLPYLQSVVLNGNNFGTTDSVIVANLSSLTSFTAQNNCFAKATVKFLKNPALTTLQLGRNTARDGELVLDSRRNGKRM